MRQERSTQTSIFDLFAGHEIGRELKAMSEWLDEHRTVLGSFLNADPGVTFASRLTAQGANRL